MEMRASLFLALAFPSIFFSPVQKEEDNTKQQHTSQSLLTTSSPLVSELVLEQELEAVAQGAHVRVHGVLQLKGVGDDFDGPVLELGVLPGLEAEVEVARVLGADAEGVHAPFRVSFRVGRQPAFWKNC